MEKQDMVPKKNLVRRKFKYKNICSDRCCKQEAAIEGWLSDSSNLVANSERFFLILCCILLSSFFKNVIVIVQNAKTADFMQ